MNIKKQGVFDTLTVLRISLIETGIVLFIFSMAGYMISEDVQFILSDYAGNRLAYYRVEEAFFTKIKLSVCIGLFLSFPVIVLKVWRIYAMKSGLTGNFFGIMVVFSSIILFMTGTFICFSYIVPFGINVLLGFGGDTLEPHISVDSYIMFCAKIVLVFGIVFELPLIMLMLSRAGLVTASVLKKYRKYAVLIIAVTSALITPPDVYSQLAVMVPLFLLYELSILLIRFTDR